MLKQQRVEQGLLRGAVRAVMEAAGVADVLTKCRYK